MMTFSNVQKMAFLIREILSDFDSSVLINQEGQVLGLKYESLADLGTFAPLVEIARKYFPLNTGDVVITNDPYSGGNSLSVMNFVTAIQLNDQTLYFAMRSRFVPHLSRAQKIDDEGLRIPPTPIATNYQINEPILTAISAHPLCLPAFESRVRDVLNKLKSHTQLVQTICKKQSICFSKASQKHFISETKNKLQNILSEYANGENKLDLRFETGEIIRLKTEIKSGEIHFDFSGTTQSRRMFTTNHTTHGTCIGAVLSFLGQKILVNEGVFSLIGVTTPQDCMLNAKHPAPVFEGLAEICSLLASGITQSISEITGSKAMGVNGSIPTIVSFDFGSGNIFFDPIAGGTGAGKDLPGVDSFYHWSIPQRHMSIEQVEKKYPVLIRESTIRNGSGGKGQFAGGNGMVRDIEVLQDCTMKWLIGHRNLQTKGLKGASPGMPSEITHIAADGTKKSVDQSVGELSLKKGDRILSMSAGGGGFGKANS